MTSVTAVLLITRVTERILGNRWGGHSGRIRRHHVLGHDRRQLVGVAGTDDPCLMRVCRISEPQHEPRLYPGPCHEERPDLMAGVHHGRHRPCVHAPNPIDPSPLDPGPSCTKSVLSDDDAYPSGLDEGSNDEHDDDDGDDHPSGRARPGTDRHDERDRDGSSDEPPCRRGAESLGVDDWSRRMGGIHRHSLVDGP